MLWSTREQRMQSDDMFVGLEEAGDYLFWCTNQGYYSFMPFAAMTKDADDGDSSSSPQELLDDFDEFVSPTFLP